MKDHQLVLLLLGSPLVLCGVVAAWLGARRARIARAIEETRTSPVARLTEGALAEVVGKARPIPELVLPLRGPQSQRPCLYYEYLEERGKHELVGRDGEVRAETLPGISEPRRRRAGERRRERWETVRDERRGNPLFVEDATGRVTVDVTQAQTYLKSTEGGGDRSHWEESLIVEGDELYVLGTVQGGALVKGRHGVLVVSSQGQLGAFKEFEARARQAYVVAAIATAVGLLVVASALLRR